ncbi:hypothetical protein DEM27_05725 [Metarhizobium album]|uniref:Scaffolding protein n=1 Tax=Metarhizobium album TaxID=2182425 RepID=A0A2U2DVB3_9HYPH|nr:hypothetical protein [Rhizobium album]PWE57139.1 hypothetical protein DEM27_05725 [Rhizobium album]
MNDSANLPEDGGSKTVDAFSLNDPRALDFAEFGEDDDANTNPSQDNGDDAAELPDGEDDDLPSDLPDDAETGDDDGQSSDDDDEQSIDDAKLDDTVITLKGGEQVPVKELKLGYMRERDYRSKTQEVANSRRNLEAMSQRVEQTAAALSKFLVDQLPPEPDRALAVKDPTKFASQKAVYDAAMEQVNELLTLAGEPKEVANALTEEQQREKLLAEKKALHEAFPDLLKSKDQHEKFFDDAFDTARQIGFSDQELARVTDHRYFKLAHYARLGMQAEAAKKKAMDKVANAPAPVAPAKASNKTQQKTRQNQDAMKRLARTGSIKDAMAIDFE